MCARLKDSVTGQTAFEPNPSASRWYSVSPDPFDPALPAPENTVTIVTVWPSSRRLAIRPPQESATSSGWGATKTCVMAGRVYRADFGDLGADSLVAVASVLRREAALADQR